MIWDQLKSLLEMRDDYEGPKIKRMLNIAKAWGSFGTGSGGQMCQYIISKILQFDADQMTHYQSCGKWWPKYAKYYPHVTGQADIIKIQTTRKVEDAPAQAILQSSYVHSVQGISLKTSHRINKKYDQISTRFKVYAAGASYCANTFGKFIKEANSINQVIQLTREQIKQKVNNDPIKIQFDCDSVKIFRVPVKDIWKQITRDTWFPNPKYPLQQGRFSIIKQSEKKAGKDPVLLSAVGDRIMIGECFDKQQIKKDMVEIKLEGYDFHQNMMSEFQQFVLFG